jgi:hypothetical protein
MDVCTELFSSHLRCWWLAATAFAFKQLKLYIVWQMINVRRHDARMMMAPSYQSQLACTVTIFLFCDRRLYGRCTWVSPGLSPVPDVPYLIRGD